MVRLATLPAELWLHIFWQLDPESVVAFSLANKACNNIVNNLSDNIFKEMLPDYLPSDFLEGNRHDAELNPDGKTSDRAILLQIAQRIVSGNITETNAFSTYWHNVKSLRDLCLRAYRLKLSWSNPAKWGTFGALACNTSTEGEPNLVFPVAPRNFKITRGLYIQPTVVTSSSCSNSAKDTDFITVNLSTGKISIPSNLHPRAMSDAHIEAFRDVLSISMRGYTGRTLRIMDQNERHSGEGHVFQNIGAHDYVSWACKATRLRNYRLVHAGWLRYCSFDANYRVAERFGAIRQMDAQLDLQTYQKNARYVDHNDAYTAIIGMDKIALIPHLSHFPLQLLSFNDHRPAGPDVLSMKLVKVEDSSNPDVFKLRHYELEVVREAEMPSHQEQDNWIACHSSHDGNVLVAISTQFLMIMHHTTEALKHQGGMMTSKVSVTKILLPNHPEPTSRLHEPRLAFENDRIVWTNS